MNHFTIIKLSIIPLVLLVLILAWQNRQLQQDNKSLKENMTNPYVGMWVPELGMETLQGKSIVVGKPNNDFQILIFFNPTCNYCYASISAINQLYTHIKNDNKTQLIGIFQAGRDETAKYARQNRLNFTITASTDLRIFSLFRAQAVPLILIIDNSGRVKYHHRGLLSTQEDIDIILSAIHNMDVDNVANNPVRDYHEKILYSVTQ